MAAARLHLDALAADIRLRAIGGAHVHVALAGECRGRRRRSAPSRSMRAIECVMRLFDMLAAPGAAGAHARCDPGRRTRRVQLRRCRSRRRFSAPGARPAADPIGVHRLSSGGNAVGIGLPFGHSDSETLSRLIDAGRRSGAAGLRTAPGRALLSAGSVARRDAQADRRSGRARLHHRSRRSAPQGRRLRRRADLRVGRDRRARAGAGAGRRGADAARWRGHPCFRLRQGLRPSGTRAARGVRPRRALRRVRRWRAVVLGDGRRAAGDDRATHSVAEARDERPRLPPRRRRDLSSARSPIIRAETDLSRFSEDEADIVVRMVHACGSPEAARAHRVRRRLRRGRRAPRSPPARRSCAIPRWWRTASPARGCRRATT